MIQDFHITGAAGTTIVPQVSFMDYFKVGLDMRGHAWTIKMYCYVVVLTIVHITLSFFPIPN